jgi:hypothetical protein
MTMRATQLTPGDSPSINSTGVRVAMVDVDVPFVSLLKLSFKCMAAGAIVSLCLFPMLLILLFVFMARFGNALAHLFSSFPRP